MIYDNFFANALTRLHDEQRYRVFVEIERIAGRCPYAVWRFAWQQGGGNSVPGAIGLFLLSYAGIAVSLYPMIVPYQLTLWEAASSTRTQAFLLVGTLFLLPVILTYSGWSYWVFRGKVRGDIGYH